MWKGWRLTNRFLRWCEPLCADIDVGSCGSSIAQTFDGRPDLLYPAGAPPPLVCLPFAADSAQAPRLSNDLFDSSPLLDSVSPLSHDLSVREEGDGAFSSATSAARCMTDLNANNIDDTMCLAHVAYPSDSSSKPLSVLPCLSVGSSHCLLLGDEIVTQDNLPHRIPWIRRTTVLCSDHGVACERRSGAYLCAVKDCYRIGFPIVLGGRSTLACAMHLDDQLTHMGAGEHVDDLVIVTPPDNQTKQKVAMQKRHEQAVSVKRHTKGGFDAVLSSSETSSGSEFRGERESEMSKLAPKDKPTRDTRRASKRKSLDKERDAEVAHKKSKLSRKDSASSPRSDTSIEIESPHSGHPYRYDLPSSRRILHAVDISP